MDQLLQIVTRRGWGPLFPETTALYGQFNSKKTFSSLFEMGKVMSLINATPDGFLDGKYAVIDAEFYEFTHGLLADTRTIAFGRTTFELFQNRWPSILRQKINS